MKRVILACSLCIVGCGNSITSDQDGTESASSASAGGAATSSTGPGTSSSSSSAGGAYCGHDTYDGESHDVYCMGGEVCLSCDGMSLGVHYWCSVPQTVREGQFECGRLLCDIETEYCSSEYPDDDECHHFEECKPIADPSDWCPCIDPEACYESRDGAKYVDAIFCERK